MKHISAQFTLLLAFFCCSIIPLTAQHSLGLRTGVHFADVSVPNLEVLSDIISPPRTNSGGQFGILMNFPISDRTSIQTELSYIQKGFRVSDAVFDQLFGENFTNDLGIDAKTTFHYLEFSPLLKVKLGENTFTPYFAFAPYVGYAMSGNIKEEVNIIINITLNQTDINLQKEIYNRLDIGAMGGFGLQLDFKRGFAFTDLMFGYSFTDFVNNQEVQLTMRNLGIRWGIGIAFFLKKK